MGEKNRVVIDSSVLDWSQDLVDGAWHREWQNDAKSVMEAIRKGGLHVAVSQELYEEIKDQIWNRKRREFPSRGYAREWIRSLEQRGYLDRLHVDFEHRLNGDQLCGEEMVKDAHLIESALSSDFTVISRDEKRLACWIELCVKDPPPAVLTSQPRIRSIVWADTRIQGQDVISWLESGAPNRADWRLDRQPRLEEYARRCPDWPNDRCILHSGHGPSGHQG